MSTSSPDPRNVALPDDPARRLVPASTPVVPELDEGDAVPMVTFSERSRMPAVLLAGDIAAVFGLPSLRAAREFIAKHEIPHQKFGGKIVVLADSLLAFLAQRQADQPREEAARRSGVQAERKIRHRSLAG